MIPAQLLSPLDSGRLEDESLLANSPRPSSTSGGVQSFLGGSVNGGRANDSGGASGRCASVNCGGNLGDAGCRTTTCGGSADIGQAGCGAVNCAGGAGDHEGDVGPDPPVSDRSRYILETALEIDASKQTGIATITLAPSSSRGASFEVRGLAIASVTDSGGLLQWAPRGAWIDVGVPPSTEPLVLRIEYSSPTTRDQRRRVRRKWNFKCVCCARPIRRRAGAVLRRNASRTGCAIARKRRRSRTSK